MRRTLLLTRYLFATAEFLVAFTVPQATRCLSSGKPYISRGKTALLWSGVWFTGVRDSIAALCCHISDGALIQDGFFNALSTTKISLFPDFYTNQRTIDLQKIGPNQTQPPTLSGMGNEYRPKCSDALQLGSKGSTYVARSCWWINVWL